MSETITLNLGPGSESSGDGWTYKHTYELVEVVDPDAGPCKDCDKPMVRVKAKQHVNHNETKYTQTFDFLYAHADGDAPHLDTFGSYKLSGAVKPRCPKCKAYGTVEFRQLAYGNETECPCGYRNYASIGD